MPFCRYLGKPNFIFRLGRAGPFQPISRRPGIRTSTTKRGFSAAGSFGFDADVNQLQFVSAQATYNWDCCGMTLEYRSYTVANVRNENLFLLQLHPGKHWRVRQFATAESALLAIFVAPQ
jgi:hypothetical protein